MPNTAFQQIAGASALLAGIVLLTAGIPKMLRPARFARQITAYGVTPAAASPVLARVVSAGEAMAGLLLLAGLAAPPPLRQAGAGLAALLFAVFLAALVSVRKNGRHIACACFGGNSELETVDTHSIVRTALLFVLAVLALSPIHSARPLEIAGFAVILASCVALVSELTRLLGPLRRTTGAIVVHMKAAAVVADNAEVTP